jgi:hypothetical protein
MLGQPHPITFCYFYETGGANAILSGKGTESAEEKGSSKPLRGRYPSL